MNEKHHNPRTYTIRYTLVALAISILFVMLYTTLEMSEQQATRTFTSFLAEVGHEYWLVLTMPLTLIPLATWAGRQRDRVTADARDREALSRILRILIDTPDPDLDQTLSDVLPVVAATLNVDEAAVLVRPHEHWIIRAATSGVPETVLIDLMPMPPWPPANRDLVVLNLDRSAPPDRPPRTSYHGAVLQIVATEAQPLGWLLLLSRAPRRPLRHEADWLATVADQIGAALTRAHQYAWIRRRARDLEALAQINRTLLAGMDLDELLETIVHAAQVRFGLPYVTVMWIDESAGEFYLRAQAGPLTASALPNFRQKLTEGLAAEVRRTGQPYLARDTRHEPAYIPPVKADIRSLLLAPLKVAGQIIGVMTFESLDLDEFSDEDVAALTTLADQAAIAAENARLLTSAQRERQRVTAILRSTRDAVLLSDTSGLVQLINPAAEHLVGRSAADVIGHPIDQLLPADISAAATAEQSFEVTLDNDLTYLVTVNTARDEGGTVFGRVVILRDITYLKQLDQFKSQMLQLASHDLRTPLGVAFGYLDVLLEDLHFLLPLHEKALRGIETALNRMQTLVTELLDLERVEAGFAQLDEPIEVGGLVATVVLEYADMARAKQQRLELRPADQPLRIHGDPARLKQALSNLISNAVKYTPEGGQITVRLNHVAQYAQIEVRDTGYGISTEAQAKLFQRFFRAKAPGTENIAGTGLGLSLAKAVIDQHGGKIIVESEIGQGSTFQVWLPIRNGD